MKQLTKNLPKRIKMRYPVVRLMTLIVVMGIMTVAVPALAAENPTGTAFDEVITSITDLIKGLTLIVGILGITLWGFGKVARPVFPEIAQLTSQYIQQFIIGIVVVYAATEIVDMVAGAVGGGA